MKKNTCLYICALISGSLVSAWDLSLLFEETSQKKSDHFLPISVNMASAIERDARRILLKQAIQNLEWERFLLKEEITDKLNVSCLPLDPNTEAFLINQIKCQYCKKYLIKIKKHELAYLDKE